MTGLNSTCRSPYRPSCVEPRTAGGKRTGPSPARKGRGEKSASQDIMELYAKRWPPRMQKSATNGCSNLAEREGFEPSERLHAQRFSRPPRSTTLAPLQRCKTSGVTSEARPSRLCPYNARDCHRKTSAPQAYLVPGLDRSGRATKGAFATTADCASNIGLIMVVPCGPATVTPTSVMSNTW